MSVDVEVETMIDRPCAEVAAYTADPTNAPEWYANIESVEWRTEPPVTAGSEMDFVARFLGRRLAYTYRVTDFEPGQRLMMETAEGPFPMCTTYTWEPVGDATRMTLRNTGSPTGFGRITAPVMAAAMRRATAKDLTRLRNILERSNL